MLALLIAVTATPTAAIDINTAPPAVLVLLPGIGEKRALDIVAARAKRRFSRPRDLLRVRGIGRKTLAKLLPWVRVTPDLSRRRNGAASVPSAGGPDSGNVRRL